MAPAASSVSSSAVEDGPPPNTLRVTIHECRSLVPADTPAPPTASSPAQASVSTRLNPCVRVQAGRGDLRTSAKTHTSNPSFEETLVFPVSDVSPGDVTFTVEHASSFGLGSRSSNTPIATLAFEASDLIPLRGRRMRRVLPLMNIHGSTDRPRGEIDVTLAWEWTKYGDTSPTATAGASTVSAVVQPIARRLTPQQAAELEEDLASRTKQTSASGAHDQRTSITSAGNDSSANASSADDAGDASRGGEVLDGVSAGYVDDDGPEATGGKGGSEGTGGGSKADPGSAAAHRQQELKQRREAEDAERRRLEEAAATPMKTGDYSIAVHIIEGRGLKPSDPSGTSDPVVYVNVAGQTQHTRIVQKRNDAVWDQTLLFSLKQATQQDLEQAQITISVFDADTFSRNDLIGSYSFDLPYVYARQHHEVYKAWVGLTNESSTTNDRSLAGLLRLSVSVLGPGDKLHVRTAAQEAADEAAGAAGDTGADGSGEGGSSDISGLILMPPSIERRLNFLVITAYSASGLPSMDNNLVGPGGIDAFLQVDYGGQKAKTKWVSVRGNGNLDVSWYNELWIPVMMPTMVNNILVRVKDYDRLKANETVGAIRLSLKDIQSRGADGIGPAWYPLYGPPDGVDGHSSKAKHMMERHPDTASTYRGRVLLSARIEGETGTEIERVHTKAATQPPDALLPATSLYRIRALVILGDEIPSFNSTATGILSFLGGDVGVMVTCGGKSAWTPRVRPDRGAAAWRSFLEFDVVLPAMVDEPAGEDENAPRVSKFCSPLPDTIIYLYRGDPASSNRKACQRLCYARLDTAALIERGFDGCSPAWQVMREDTCFNGLGDEETSGSVLMRVGMERVPDAVADTLSGADGVLDTLAVSAAEWKAELAQASALSPYELRVHVFRGEHLPSADEDGSLDPYLRVSLNGVTKRTNIKHKTTHPGWFETISIPCMLPSLRLAPQVHVQLWDWDAVTSDDFVSELRYPLASPDTQITNGDDDAGTDVSGGSMLRPQWYRLTRLESGATNRSDRDSVSHGSLLLAVQLVRKASPTQLVKPLPAFAIQPQSNNCYVEILVLGLRGMESYAGLPLMLPYVEFDLGDGYGHQQAAAVATSSAPGKVPKGASLAARVRCTIKSRVPSGSDPNFCERILVPASMPVDSLFSGAISVLVRDHRLGGLLQPVVGTCSIRLGNKLPWAAGYQTPRGTAILSGQHPEYSSAAATGDTDDEDDGDDADGDESSSLIKVKASASSKQSARDAGDRDGAYRDVDSDDEAAGRRQRGKRATAAAMSSGTALSVNTNTGSNMQPGHEASDIDEFGMDLSRNLISIDGAHGLQDDDAAVYMAGRRVYGSGLEDVFLTTPFETYNIVRGQRVGGYSKSKDTTHVCGVMKGIVRVISSPDEAPPIDVAALKTPRQFVVRVYALAGTNLTPHDAGGTSDPYIVLRLGNQVVSGRADYVSKTVNPEFYRVYEIKATLPGQSRLSVECWDMDLVSSDDLIGSTTVDLEDRWFEPSWQALGKEHESGTRYRPKPVETRTLWCPKSSAPQGSLRMWVDILTPQQAQRYPPVKISPPPPAEYEVRCIVWGTRDVKLSGSCEDLFVRGQLQGDPVQQESDTHWRCRDGSASFNWRMKFNVKLPCKFPYLNLQLYDRDIAKYNDLIGEAVLDLGQYFKRANKDKTAPVQCFDTEQEVVGDKLWKAIQVRQQRRREREQEVETSGEVEDVDDGGEGAEHVAIDVDGRGTGAVQPGRGKPQRGARPTATSPRIIARSKRRSLDASSASAASPSPLESPSAPNALLSAALKSSPIGKVAAAAGVVPSPLALIGGGGAAGSGKDDAGDSRDAARQLKSMLGAVQSIVRPRHAKFVPMYKIHHGREVASGGVQYEQVGELLLSIEVLPKEVAERYPAGLGRKEPNSYPLLPPPAGRMKLSLNPLSVFRQLIGPRAYIAIMLSLIASAGTGVLVFGIPFIGQMSALVGKLGSGAETAIWVILGILVLGMVIGCVACMRCKPAAVTRVDVDVYGSASDILSGEGAWDPASALAGGGAVEGSDGEDGTPRSKPSRVSRTPAATTNSDGDEAE